MKFLWILFIPLSVYSRERIEFYNGVRGLGMGDTSTVIVNDETALAQNPAGLGKLRDFYGTILDPEIDVGSNALAIQKAQAFSQPTKIIEAVPSMVTSANTYYSYRQTLFPSFVAKNFGLGLLINTKLAGIAASSTSADVFYRDDMALLLGYNLRLLDGRIKIGFSGKAISRVELDETTLNPTTQSLAEDALATAGLLKSGTGFGADVGLILTAPWIFLPSIGAVARDVGNTNFTSSTMSRISAATQRPAMAKQDVDVAMSLSPIHSNNFRSVWTIEYKGLLTASNETDKAKLMHFGTEFNYGDVFFMRAGYNQRYWTAGAEIASEKFQFQVASYGEEVGTEVVTLEDRRYVLKIVFRF